MRVVVTGSTGLIGSALVARLRADGDQVLRLVRRAPAAPDQARWDPQGGGVDLEALAGADAVVHLAGAGIGDRLRWTARVKREIRESRVRGTGVLAEAVAALAARGGGPRALVTASGIHFYGDRGDELLTEASSPGGGFLAEVCRQWEAAADPARAAGVRVVHVRTGLVQTPASGALARQLPLFRLGVGGRLGSGRQWWSWVALDDVVGLYRHALAREDVAGPLNATAPTPVTNAAYTVTLARVLGRPALLPVPAFGPRLALGRELADELAFASIRVRPAAALASGYRFRWPELEPALRAVLDRRRPA
jgi:uncharacterized protein (TIGR01777 family)